MVADTRYYVYHTKANTTYSVTTSQATAYAAGNYVLATAWADTGSSQSWIDPTLGKGEIDTDRVEDDAIVAAKINVATLDAISANVGTLTTGTIDGITGIFGSGNEVTIDDDGVEVDFTGEVDPPSLPNRLSFVNVTEAFYIGAFDAGAYNELVINGIGASDRIVIKTGGRIELENADIYFLGEQWPSDGLGTDEIVKYLSAGRLQFAKISNANITDGVIAEAKLDVNNAPGSNQRMGWNGSKMQWYDRYDWIVRADNGADNTILDGEILDVTGDTGVETTNSGGELQIALDFSELTLYTHATVFNAADFYLVGYVGSTKVRIQFKHLLERMLGNNLSDIGLPDAADRGIIWDSNGTAGAKIKYWDDV
jgi:hypothetical protein